MKKKILVSDSLSQEGVEILNQYPDFQIDVKTGMQKEELLECIGEYDALVVRSATKVTKEVLQKGKNLKVVGRAGVGVDNVDVEEATRLGIIVMNTPEGIFFPKNLPSLSPSKISLKICPDVTEDSFVKCMPNIRS